MGCMMRSSQKRIIKTLVYYSCGVACGIGHSTPELLPYLVNRPCKMILFSSPMLPLFQQLKAHQYFLLGI